MTLYIHLTQICRWENGKTWLKRMSQSGFMNYDSHPKLNTCALFRISTWLISCSYQWNAKLPRGYSRLNWDAVPCLNHLGFFRTAVTAKLCVFPILTVVRSCRRKNITLRVGKRSLPVQFWSQVNFSSSAQWELLACPSAICLLVFSRTFSVPQNHWQLDQVSQMHLSV